MTPKALIAAALVAGLASTSAMTAPKRSNSNAAERAATRQLNEQQLASAGAATSAGMATPTAASMAPGMAMPPASQMPADAPMAPPGAPMATPGMSDTQRAPITSPEPTAPMAPSVPPQ